MVVEASVDVKNDCLGEIVKSGNGAADLFLFERDEHGVREGKLCCRCVSFMTDELVNLFNSPCFLFFCVCIVFVMCGFGFSPFSELLLECFSKGK